MDWLEVHLSNCDQSLTISGEFQAHFFCLHSNKALRIGIAGVLFTSTSLSSQHVASGCYPVIQHSVSTYHWGLFFFFFIANNDDGTFLAFCLVKIGLYVCT